MTSSSSLYICSCNKVDCFYCDPIDPFLAPSPNLRESYMSEDTLQQLQWVEEQQKKKIKTRLGLSLNVVASLWQSAKRFRKGCRLIKKIKEHEEWIKKRLRRLSK